MNSPTPRGGTENRKAQSQSDLLLAVDLRSALRNTLYMFRTLEGRPSLTMAHMSLVGKVLAEPQRVSTIAKELSIRVPSVTEQVIRLEAQGVVRRTQDPSDSRAVLVSVTDKGRALYAQDRMEDAAAIAETFGALSESEKSTLAEAVQILNKLSSAKE